LSYHSHCS